MHISDTPGALRQFRKSAWKFQRTFKTPLKNLQSFVTSIVSACKPQTACITIEAVVFEPKHLIEILTRHSLPVQYKSGMSVTGTGQQEIEELLYAALSDWVDIFFTPTPKPFVIFADHDEYTTFYANTRSNLKRVAEPLSTNAFQEVLGYKRRL
jgi:hypothetical protein